MKKLTHPLVVASTFIITFLNYSCAKNQQNSNSSSSNSNAKVDAAAAAAANCTSQGWASQNGGTTGGGSATATVVSTYSALKSAIESSSVKVIQVNGTITIPSAGQIDFKDQSDKTIFGSPGAKLVSNDQTKTGSGIMYLKRLTNVILRNLIFEGPGAYDVDGEDNCTVEACTNLWIDHCEFRDGMDGNLDIKKGSNNVTVSWTKFTYLKAPKAGGSGGSDDHRFCNLVGSSDGASSTDRGKLNITFARCWWGTGCAARMPRVRFGKVHLLNNYFSSSAASKCVQAGIEANLLIEGNVFEGVKTPVDLMKNNSTAVQLKNNSFVSTSGNTAGDGKTAFTPPYSYSALAVDSVKYSVTGAAGATLTTSSSCSASSF